MERLQSINIVLSKLSGSPSQKLELFALVNLGLIQSLASGVLTPTDAISRFYHVENCLYVKSQHRQKEAQEIMSRGIQLADLFESLSPEEAQREFYRELETMRFLCLRILGKGRTRRDPHRAAA
jgi:hypothetical protein